MKTTSKNLSSEKYISLLFVFVFSMHEIIPFAQAYQDLAMNSKSVSLNEFYYFDEWQGGQTEYKDEIRDKNDSFIENEKAENLSIIAKTSSGPNQAENSGFSVSSTDGNVDKFTGDFSYSIPLMDVEGYPISISYNSNVNMHTEASWVGLGWDLSVGAVNREMRGIPDEFNGSQKLKREYHELEQTIDDGKKNGGYVGSSITYGAFSPGVQATLLKGSYTSSYLGLGETMDFSIQGNLSIAKESEANDSRKGLSLSAQLGFSKDSKQGMGMNKGLSAGAFSSNLNQSKGISAGLGFGSSTHSRYGLRSRTFSNSISGNNDKDGSIDRSFSHSAGSTISYGTVTSLPRIQFNSSTRTFQFSLDLYAGGKLGPAVAKAGYINQKYNSDTHNEIQGGLLEQPMIGFLHNSKRKLFNDTDELPVMDFQRSGDMGNSEEMRDLPFSVQTYDIFHASANGFSGTFRAGRSDFGTYYDPTVESKTNEVDLGSISMPDEAPEIPNLLNDVLDELLNSINIVQVSTGVIFKPAPLINLGVTVETGRAKGTTASGVWEEPMSFSNEEMGVKFDEVVYFKSVGEATPNTMDAWNEFKKEEPIAANINFAGNRKFDLQNTAVGNSPGTINLSLASLNNYGKKPITASVFLPKTAQEMVAENKPTYNVLVRQYNGTLAAYSAPRIMLERRDPNHISSIDVVTTSGDKYVYGIPVYNITHNEVVFSAEGLPVDLNSGLVNYTAGIDNSAINTRGRSHLFDKSTVPAYPHSFLLTEYLSSDYVDRSNDGPSIDDVGSYYKFSYLKEFGSDGPEGKSDFQWRYPMSNQSSQAILNKGFLGSNLDDVASYSFGKKEIYYTRSVESKNMIAVFYLSIDDRIDAQEANEENTISFGDGLKKLSKIVLYNLNDYKINADASTPLQSVFFSYDYSSCPHWAGNVQNSGKLTLTSIRFQSGNSVEMALSKYQFEYTGGHNFNYMEIDAWGYHKVHTSSKPNDLYPYPDQTSNGLSAYTQTRDKLNKIITPAGGEIMVSYEPDSYGVVQHKRAMSNIQLKGMFNIFEFLKLQESNSWNIYSMAPKKEFVSKNFDLVNFQQTSGQTSLQSQALATKVETNMVPYGQKFGRMKKGMIPNNVLIFELSTPISGSVSKQDANQQVLDEYFRDPTLGGDGLLKEVYLKMLVNIKENSVDKELISAVLPIATKQNNAFLNMTGYSDDFEPFGVMPKTGSSYQYGYVILEPVNNGLQEGKHGKDEEGVMLHPFQKFALGYVRQNLPDKIYGSCVGCEGELSIDKKVIFGSEMNKVMIQAGYVKEMSYTISGDIRLFDNDQIKYGGNGRVSSIVYKDNWENHSGEYNSTYTWKYKYHLPSQVNSTSGVASFEPSSMMDESPFYTWETYVDIAKKFPDETRFHALPLAQLLYPSPVVGYSDVTVIFEDGSKYGKSHTQFHTYKEELYRTKENKTPIWVFDQKNAPIKITDLLFSDTWTNFAFSQGYVVETNDFHGKIKEQTTYDAGENIISKSIYHYKKLDKPVLTLDKKTKLASEYIALEYDIHNDSRMVIEKENVFIAGMAFNLGYTPPAFFNTSLVPTVPQFQHSEKSFYTNCLIKHINYSAVLDSVETIYIGSKNVAKNLVYDRYSGNVIISSLKDEYNDNLYSYSFPSHWYETGLGEIPIDKIGNQFNGTFSGGYFFPNANFDLKTVFSEGDILTDASNTPYYIFELNSAFMKLINSGGNFVSAVNLPLRLKKSNKANRLDETMQSLVTKTPINLTLTNNFQFPTNNIISSSAISYRNKNDLRCGQPAILNTGNLKTNEVNPGQIVNPFVYGVKGDLVMESQFAWQGERSSIHPHGVRFNGTYANDFSAFYTYQSNAWMSKINNLGNWRKMGNVTKYDEYGQTLEVKDQIGVISSVLYGYNAALSLVPVAQAVNAGVKEIAFDGFEDYIPMADNIFITESHFDFKHAVPNVSLSNLDNTGPVSISSKFRHSGKYSLKLGSNKAIIVTKKATSYCAESVPPKDESGRDRISGSDPINPTNTASECFCIPPFSPTPGQTYLVSAWVKTDAINLVSITVNTSETNGANPSLTTLPPESTDIDGWRKIEGSFTIPANHTEITVGLSNSSKTYCYFDDLRIHPYLAGMTTVVYDDKTLLPMATHDGYNYTTFYNYDENLNLVRVRVETVEGIKTISESEMSVRKN